MTTGPALDTATATPEQEQQAKTKYGARESSRTDTAALGSPEKIGEMVALLLVRPEIKSASDFGKQVVAVDASSAAGAKLEKAFVVASGAFHIRLSENLVRVIDGNVPAAVATAMRWKPQRSGTPGLSGFNVRRIALPSAPQKAKPG